MMSLRISRVFLVLSISLFLLSGKELLAQAQVGQPVTPYVFSGDLSQIASTQSVPNIPPPPRATSSSTNIAPRPHGLPDPLWQKTVRGNGGGVSTLGVTPPQFTNPNPNFDTNQPGDGPPDANGAVGPNHYIAIVNFTFEIFNKAGTSLAGPTNPATLWASAPMGDACKSQRGDPYAVYDHIADRWLLSYFANNPLAPGDDPLQYECVAISKGPNPVTDGWFAYSFLLGVSNDYPKFGLWPDGYYMVSQRGYDGTSSLDVWVFDRANMLNGNPATFQHPSFPVSEHDVITLPGDLTGPLPPAGSPNFYARPYDGNLYSDGSPRIEIFEFHTDWGNPANTTFKLVQTITPATFRSDICDGGDLDQFCVPQPNSSSTLDALSIWPMSPLQYRNFGDHESLLFSHGVNVDGAGLVGVRWHELRRSPVGSGSWTLYQESTFAPADSTTTTTTSIHRWTPSIGMDQAGNIALGYNVSNDGIAPHPTVFPGLRIVGRLAGDPLGEMTTPEVHLADGGSSLDCRDKMNNPTGCRWGDYSALRVDPADGCTFWYTTEYESASGQQTHVGAVRFPTCNPADLSVTKSGPATVTAGNQLTYTMSVTNNGPSTATNVIVKDTLPAGVGFQTTSIVCKSGTITSGCNIGTMANGASTTFTLTIKVPADFLSSRGVSTLDITNTVTVSSDQLDPDTSSNTATATTSVVESADLSITKLCKPDTTAALAGSTSNCTMQVTNNGPSDAQFATLADNIVASTPFTIISVTPSVGTCTASSGTKTTGSVNCTFGTIAAGATVTVTVSFSALNAGDINDTASVTAATPDPNTSNNTATGAVTYVAVADVSVVKTAAANVVAGTNLTYTVTASNAGPSIAANVVVKDTLPGQISVVSVTPSVGTCTAGIPGNPAQPLTCTLGSLASGASATVTVVVNVNANVPTGTILTNNATVSSSANDPNNNNNSSTAFTNVVGQADLAIVKTSDKTTYKPSTIITYTIQVTNIGPSDALAVVVTDNLPPFKQATYKSDTGGCTLSATTLTCNLGTMPVGTSKSFNIYELVNGNQGTVSNTATVAGANADPVSGNNTSTRIVTVGK
jgi:uncharacterized repeat protein (TIGR01451 family)